MTNISPEGKAKLHAFLSQDVGRSRKLPGFVVSMTNIDEEIFYHGELEAAADSIFWICEQTKLVTSIAALKLIDAGKLSYDTLVSDYFPQFRTPVILDPKHGSFKCATTPVTVKHLLDSSSGLFYHPFPPPRAPPFQNLPAAYTSKKMHQAADPVAEFFKIIVGDLPGVPLEFEPGTAFSNGYSADVLGFLVEKVSGKTLEQFCQEHIFKPLDVTASFYLTPELKKRFVVPSLKLPNGDIVPLTDQLPLIEQDHRKVRLHLGGIGLYMSMPDYLKIFRHLLQIKGGRGPGSRTPILKPETAESIFTPMLTELGESLLGVVVGANPGEVSYSTAMAVLKKPVEGGRRVGSTFWDGWLGSGGFVDPKTGIALVFGVQLAHGVQDDAVQIANWALEQALYQYLE